MMSSPHVPVLLDEVLAAFEPVQDGTIIDCTLGYAGHSSAILAAKAHCNVIGIDQDETAIAFSRKQLETFAPRVEIRRGRFSEKVGELLATNQHISALLADIGVSSLQLDDASRGFSFRGDALDMRMDQTQQLNAKAVVNQYDYTSLVRVLQEYGEINNAAEVANEIIKKRPFHDAQALASLQTLRKKRGVHPATLLFQAIRIEVNDELGELRRLLDTLESTSHSLLVAIITFHSLEDRMVKQRFNRWSKSCICPPEAMRCSCGNNHQKGRIVSKKPITASQKELKQNPRSRSAKLRLFKFRGADER